MNRRSFFTRLLVGAASLPFIGKLLAQSEPEAKVVDFRGIEFGPDGRPLKFALNPAWTEAPYDIVWIGHEGTSFEEQIRAISEYRLAYRQKLP